VCAAAIAQNIERERQERAKIWRKRRAQRHDGGAHRHDGRAHRVSGARQCSGGVEKYSSIASRQAPEHGSKAISPGPPSRISAAVFSAQLMHPRRWWTVQHAQVQRPVRGYKALKLSR